MLKHKSFAYFIILKREYSSGYMRKKPTNPTKLKYFNHLIKAGLISGTNKGWRLKNLRGAINDIYGYQFKIINYSNNIQEMTEFILDGLVFNKLKQQYRAAKSLLATKTGNVVRKKGSRSVRTFLLAGKIHVQTKDCFKEKTFDIKTSSRSMAKSIGISQTMANYILNRIEKIKMIEFDITKKGQRITKYIKGIYNERYVWTCERYLIDIIKVPFNSILKYTLKTDTNQIPIMS